MTMTISAAIKIARRFTKKATEIKDYKLRKADKERKKQACSLMNGKGYIVATAEELGMKYNGRKHIWCYYANCVDSKGKVVISLIMIR